MVERLHRLLRAALMSHAAHEYWVDNLPIVLLGIRSFFKPNINACAAELIYGSTRRLIGEFWSKQHNLLLVTPIRLQPTASTRTRVQCLILFRQMFKNVFPCRPAL